MKCHPRILSLAVVLVLAYLLGIAKAIFHINLKYFTFSAEIEIDLCALAGGSQTLLAFLAFWKKYTVLKIFKFRFVLSDSRR